VIARALRLSAETEEANMPFIDSATLHSAAAVV
jgi:hypothetical protein